ncbi:MAG: stage V sporulation protein AD, partial [Oscillospiraceae bacterium]|nr:stage V sporulation protein AD [Oscillospiraceae bacterium]
MGYCTGKTFRYDRASIQCYAAVVGRAENEGPYGGEFDEVIDDNRGGADTWEQAEAQFQ